jgi:hypothetical protein
METLKKGMAAIRRVVEKHGVKNGSDGKDSGDNALRLN